MAKYTEEQLFELKEVAHVPQPAILEAFNQLVEQVKEHAAAEQAKRTKFNNGDTYIDENGNERAYHTLNRRRLSRSGGTKPNNLRKKAVEEVDENGWATFTKPKKSFGEENGDERTKFRESLKEGSGPGAGNFRAKPNNKNLGSSKAVDSRDATETQKHTFNAFAALDDDE